MKNIKDNCDRKKMTFKNVIDKKNIIMYYVRDGKEKLDQFL
mgnify:CR=1 FL=1